LKLLILTAFIILYFLLGDFFLLCFSINFSLSLWPHFISWTWPVLIQRLWTSLFLPLHQHFWRYQVCCTSYPYIELKSFFVQSDFGPTQWKFYNFWMIVRLIIFFVTEDILQSQCLWHCYYASILQNWLCFVDFFFSFP
jgi:hypothetical protein